MKALVLAIPLLVCVVGYSESARAQEEIRIRPIDGYFSGFGGYSFPFKTDFSFPGLTLRDVELDNNPSLGAKLGMWFTAPRKTLGIDVGAEIDVTSFHPYASKGQVVSTNLGLSQFVSTFDFHALYFGVNVLARIPMGVTPELPNGRWFPYIGVGGGGLRLTFQLPGMNESQSTAPAFQGVGGVKVFITKHFAAFAEGKFIHASNSIEVQFSGSGDLTINSVHGVCGLSFHFF